ncbi:MAG TPA: pitrilysin family protein [Fimbriimonadaceae bacterium]|nr:pitrilysin family protein [Fimbriimonadaceae bacterium]
MGITKTVLDNGVRVLCEPVGHVGSASVGLWCNTGSVHEQTKEAGITHFIEHMLFKGTTKRTAKQIAEEIEGRGGMLNAFTDKERTCYYCRVLDVDVEVAIDVLSDMVTDSLLDKDELAMEKGVVLEEIKRSEDEPSDHVHDLHLQSRWPEHILGKPVIGTPESVSSFGPDDLRTYMARRYRAGQIVLSVAGNIEPDAVNAWAEKRLGSVEPGDGEAKLDRPRGKASVNEVGKDVEQVHFCIGTDGSSQHDKDRYVALMLDGVLGSGMSSRLFQEVREKRGLAYAIGSYNLTYSVGGAFTVYGGTSAEKWGEVQEVVRAEFDKLCRDGADPAELARVKKSIEGSIVLALEGMSARMMRMARNEMVYGRDVPVEEVLASIEAVTNDQIIEYARKALDPSLVSTTAIGPFKN